MKLHLALAILLVGGTLLIAPQASAACEPGADPEYCTGLVSEQVDRTLDRINRICQPDLLDPNDPCIR